MVPFESFSCILDFEMELVDMVQDRWETQAFWRVAGAQAVYHRILQMALKMHKKPTESSLESLNSINLFSFNMLQFKKMTGNLLAALSLEMGNLMHAPRLPLRQLMKRLETKIDGRIGN